MRSDWHGISERNDGDQPSKGRKIIGIVGHNPLDAIGEHGCHNIGVVNLATHALFDKCQELGRHNHCTSPRAAWAYQSASRLRERQGILDVP